MNAKNKVKDATKRVVIVGGGLAGLYSAYLLAKEGVYCALYEAASEFGGRIKGKSTSSDAFFLDLGPSWVFPHQTTIQKVLEDFGLPLVSQFAEGPALFQTSKNMPPQRVNGVAPAEMYRIKGGTVQLIKYLLSQLEELGYCEMHLNHRVQSIVRQSAAQGTKHRAWALSFAEGDNVAICEHLIIAAAPRVIAKPFNEGLKAANASFDTKPNKELAALTGVFTTTPTWMAAQAKFVATFEKPFWKDSGLSGQAFSQVGPLTEIHDAGFSDENGGIHALFGFCGISAQQRQQVSQQVIMEASKRQLVEIFGQDASHPLSTHYFDWATNPNIATLDDTTEPSQHPFCDLEAYVNWMQNNDLYLASSEFSRLEAGYMEGAIIAATDAVSRLVNRYL